VIITQTEKLYSPLEFYLHNPREEEANGEYGTYDLYDDRYKISVYDAAEHMDAIELAIRRDRDRMDQTRGMAEYLDGSLGDKVVSLFPEVENYGTIMVCAATVTLLVPLTTEEMSELKSWWRSQLADGWGEGFEQREIKVGREELYVVPWSSGDDFFIDTEREFYQRQGLEMPDAQREAVPETPAQAALHELGIFDEDIDCVDTSAHMSMLTDRVNANYIEYIDGLRGMDDGGITDYSAEIATMSEAHYYITNRHNFHFSELDYLLKFKDPLRVVAEAFDANRDEAHSDIMWKIFHEQDALQNGRHELLVNDSAKETTTPLPDPTGKGYVFATADGSDFYIPDALHVERDDSMMMFRHDEDAADAAKRDGVPLITGMDGVPDDVYIDVPENRGIIEFHLVEERHRRLNERAEQNWNDYRNASYDTTADNLYHIAVQVVSRRDACSFMKDYDGFTAEQLNCLLQFANPVELVADYLDPKSDISEMPGILANVLEEQENFKNHYALMQEEEPPGVEEQEQQLRDRLADNYSVYKRDMLDLGKEGIFYAAAEILPVQEAYGYFTQEHVFTESDVKFLLKFENPLEVISDRWTDRMAVTEMVDAIFANQERTLQNGGYTLASDAPASAPESPRKAVGVDEKPSVMDRIRQAAKEKQERPAAPRDTADHKKSGPEL